MPTGRHALHLATESLEAERAAFRRRTFAHLACALAALVGLEAILLPMPGLGHFVVARLSASWGTWLVVVGGVMVVGLLVQFGSRSPSLSVRYLALVLAVLLEGAILFPLLHLLQSFFDRVVPAAALLVLGLAGGLGLSVLLNRHPVPWIILGLAVPAVVVLVLWGPTPAILGAIAAVTVLAALILVCAALVLPKHDPEQPIAATLALLASAATLSWLALRKLFELYAGSE